MPLTSDRVFKRALSFKHEALCSIICLLCTGGVKAFSQESSEETQQYYPKEFKEPPALFLETTPENPALAVYNKSAPSTVQQPPIPPKEEYPQKGIRKSTSGPYFTGEWLYWKTRQGGMDYAITTTSSVEGELSGAHTKEVEFGWHSGWRAGVGYDLPYDGWDVYTNYLHFNPKASQSAQQNFIYPSLSYQGENPVSLVTFASSQWNINMHSWEVEAGREFLLSKSFSLRPHGGVKGGRIDQHTHITYSGGDPSGIPTGQSFLVNLTNNFSGTGLKIGVDADWQLGGGIGICNALSAAALCGTFHISQVQNQKGLDQIDLKEKLHRIAPMLQYLLGVSGDWRFCKDRIHLGLSANFEMQYWWDQNQMTRFPSEVFPTPIRETDSLSFYGLSCGARLDF